MDSYSPSSMMEITSYPFITPTSTVLARATTQFPFAYHPQLPPPSSSSVISSDPSNTTTTATTTTTYDASSKKKRGRPRKYSSDGNNITHMPSFAGHGGDSGGSDSSSTPSTETRVKKRRGRPPGSGKKHLGASGDGEVFEHHVILVESGEDVAERVMAYCLQGSRKLCILSASGLVSNVILQRTPLSSGTATYVVLLKHNL
ncbi:putative PPC domain, AT hook, DNA-binding protein [Lupinus albus]|uniref:AT-hook motif nuclear-localized protein n=1 Tax=Lupinus albus TaxID=3870 RepID=A0A6A4Q003_LUPAL|nr:putative PPC domain, AT hook, DNA-binding protein [Lupinus albus]